MAERPLLTVAIPTFNRARFLKASIPSVFRQDFKDYELLIIDNCSSDDTAQVVRKFSDPRVRFLSNPRNLGIVPNFNRCLSEARGKYVVIFGSDDVMLPGMLREEVEVLESNEDVVMVHASAEFINEHDLTWPTPSQRWPRSTQGADFVRLNLGDQHYTVHGSSAMFRRNAASKVGFFREGFIFSGDNDYWNRLAFVGKIVFLDKVLSQYRMHPQMESAKGLQSGFLALKVRHMYAVATQELLRENGCDLTAEIEMFATDCILKEIILIRLWGAKLKGIFEYTSEACRLFPSLRRRPRLYVHLAIAILPPYIFQQLRGARDWLRTLFPNTESSAQLPVSRPAGSQSQH